MSSMHTTGTSNLQPGQSPAKPSQVESTANVPPPNVAQPLYQNNPNQQFIPNNIPLINPAQQLQFQSQLSNLQQTAAFIQRQTQFLHQQQQQQQLPNTTVESQLKNQQLSNGPLGNFHNFPTELLNFFLFQSNSNLNLPLPQLNQTMSPVQQQALQTPKTVPASPPKLGQSQHTPRSGPQTGTVNNSSAQTAEANSGTSVTPSATVSEHHSETPKVLATTPTKSNISSIVSTPSSTTTDRSLDELKERTNVLTPAISKTPRDDCTLSNNATPTSDIVVQDNVSSPEVSKTLPRRKQTSAAGSSPIKANPLISPSNSTVSSVDSLIFSTPKKSNVVTVSPISSPPVTPLSNQSIGVVPITPPDKKVKQSSKEAAIVQKSAKKNELESKISPVANQKPAPERTANEELASAEIKSKRNRFPTNLYQSPTPELVLATRMSVSDANKSSSSPTDKLIIFYTDEFLAVRSDEGSFFLCQCAQNIYRKSKKCRVRWLNKVSNSDDTYELAFYDQIDKECILTSLELDNTANNNYKLTQKEQDRIDNILKKSIDVEKGILPRSEVTEENPDGLDISLYKSETQLKRPTESSPKCETPAKKVKKNANTSTGHSANRRKSHSSVESHQKNERSSNHLKKKLVGQQSRRAGESTKSPSSDPKSSAADIGSTSSCSNDDSSGESGRKKVAKKEKQKKSTESSKLVSSTSGTQRSLRVRSKK